MSREIKFRIWDLDKKEWLGESDPHSLKFYGFHLIGECMTVQSPTKWQVHGVIEQYTGLKDKNGKEIYEGDIVSKEYAGGDTQPLVVHFDETEAQFQVGGFGIDPTRVEVIGNIHENPELLQKYKELRLALKLKSFIEAKEEE